MKLRKQTLVELTSGLDVAPPQLVLGCCTSVSNNTCWPEVGHTPHISCMYSDFSGDY